MVFIKGKREEHLATCDKLEQFWYYCYEMEESINYYDEHKLFATFEKLSNV
jgi:hypothetical protein